jgi:threonine dehydratase
MLLPTYEDVALAAIRIAATRSYGGNIVFYDRYRDDREKKHLPLCLHCDSEIR